MEIKTSTYQKIGLVYGILVILLVVALGVRFWQGRSPQKSGQTADKNNVQTKDKSSYSGELSLSADTTTTRTGGNVDITVYFKAPGKKLDGVDVVLRFDPQFLSALGFSEGNYFKLVPRKDIDNKAGIIKITALESSSGEKLTEEKVALGVMHFQAQKAGTAHIFFDYTLGSTGKTTLTEQKTSQNILGTAVGMTVTVKP